MKRKVIYIVLAAMLMFAGISAVNNTAKAAEGDSYTLSLTGEFNYASGQEMIEYVNEERATQEAAALELDSQLTDAAMQRAAEIAYYFSHTRPDGTSCFTIHSRAWAENIAAGNSTASATFDQWKNSSGHWANMVDPDNTRIGIGHFKHNGLDFWVQLFGRDNADYSETRTSTSTVSVSVEVVEKSDAVWVVNNGLFDDGTELTLAPADSYQFPVGVVNAEFTYATCMIDNQSISWSSSDESVAVVDEDGTISGVSHGEAVVTGKDKTGKITFFSVNVCVGDESIDPSDLTGRTEVEVGTWSKDGYSSMSDVLENEVTVTYRGRTLVLDEEYYFSAASGDGTSVTRFTIQYMGKYIGSETHYSIASVCRYDVADQEYTGDEVKPSLYVSGGAVEGEDYIVTYTDNVEIGTGYVTVTGIGYYHGTVTKSFQIVCSHSWDEGAIEKAPTCAETGLKVYHCIRCEETKTETMKKLGHEYSVTYTVDKTATATENGTKSRHCERCSSKTAVTTIYAANFFELSTKKYVYNGKARKPSVTVKDSQGNTLANGTDYTVKYADGRTKTGQYKVVVTLKGSYSGTKNLYFTIVPKAPASASANLRTASGGYDDVKFTWKKSEGATGYLVYYKKSSADSWSGPVTVTGKTSYTKKNLADGVKYKFKVIPYYQKTEGGTKYYSTGQYKTASVYTLKKVSSLKVSKSSSKVKVSWKNISGETGYQISKSTSKSKTKIVSTYKTTSGKSKKLTAKKGTKYYYKVRAYKVVEGKKVYGPWSSVKSYKLK